MFFILLIIGAGHLDSLTYIGDSNGIIYATFTKSSDDEVDNIYFQHYVNEELVLDKEYDTRTVDDTSIKIIGTTEDKFTTPVTYYTIKDFPTFENMYAINHQGYRTSGLSLYAINYEMYNQTVPINLDNLVDTEIPIVIEDATVKDFKYQIATNQYTLNLSNQLLPGVKAYGKSGNVIGDESVYDNLNWSAVWKKYNMIDNNLAVISAKATEPIITYNPNNVGTAYINASKELNQSENVTYNLDNSLNIPNYESHGFVKISANEVLYFDLDIDTGNLNIAKYTLNDDVVTIDLYDSLSLSLGESGYQDYYVQYNSMDNCVYLLINTVDYLKLYTYNVNVKLLTKKFEVSGTYSFITPNFCFDNNTLFVDSSSSRGFYKFTFDGTRTTIQARSGYSSVVPISDTYIAAKDNGNSVARLYNMKTEQWTSIVTESQAVFILCDAPDGSTYLLERTTLRKIQNDTVVKTTTIDFTNCVNDQLLSSSYKYFCPVDKVPTYGTDMVLPGLYIDTTTDIAYADDLMPITALVLYKNKRTICTIFDDIRKYICINIFTDGTGRYVGLKTADDYVITKAQTAKLQKGFELEDGYINTISPEEYNTALDTSKEILGEEETVNE